jgi:hypothetical protein
MNTNFALDFIPKRMCELGFGVDYLIRARHLVLKPNETRKISAHNQLFILIDPYCDIRVESIAGLFDMSEDQANELQYEHRGDIMITNQTIFTNHARFIQVIPKYCKTLCR